MCHSLQVKDVDSLRQALPEGSAFVVCKNTLMRIAADQAGAAGWDVLKPATEVRHLEPLCVILVSP